MTADASAKNKPTALLSPKLCFKVEWHKTEMFFQEISGLEAAYDPKTKKFTNIHLERGVLNEGKKSIHLLLDRLDGPKLKNLKPDSLKISLLDGVGKTMMVWTLTNAYPVKMEILDLKLDSNEVVLDALEFTHEGFDSTK